jgi:hypothetical protein
MISTENILENLKKKQVTFAADAQENDREFTPYRKTKTQPNYALMKKQILRFFSKQEYEELTEYLKSYTPQELESFFKREGATFFIWALNISPTSQPLEFLLEKIPTGAVCQILVEKNFSLLTSFLGAQETMERCGAYSEVKKNIASEKIKILLEMHQEVVVKFIENNITDSLKEAVRKNTAHSFL